MRSIISTSVAALSNLPSEREMEVRRIRESFPAPSAGVKSFSGVQMVVNDNADNFHAGRPASNHGPPVALFDPTLGLLAYYLSHLDDDIPEIEPNHLQIGAVHMFMEQALRSYENENKRLTAIEKSLQQAIGIDMTWKQSICGIIPDAVFGGTLPYGVMEVKNEAGLEGDASLQAGLSYARIVMNGQDKVWILICVHCDIVTDEDICSWKLCDSGRIIPQS